MAAVRRKLSKLPHSGVFTRIRPSAIHGVGVFAIINIPKASNVFQSDSSKMVWINKTQFEKIPRAVKRLYRDFCIIESGGRRYGCPANFNAMTPSWYINASLKPNVFCDKKYQFIAARNIRAGEELTVDYQTYNRFAKGHTGTN